jgi:hypothetical protein
MLPKKGRREIIVNDILYHYKISGCISIIIRNSVTGEIIKWYKEYKKKWNIQFGPKEIREIILEHYGNNN